MSTDPITLTKYEQYSMFIGFLKAVESVLPKPTRDDTIMEMIMSSLNTKVVEMIFPDRDFDEKKLYKMQDEMHRLQIPDRMTSLMEEIHDRMPKKQDGTPDMETDKERVMDALFPRKDQEDDLK